MISKVIFKKIDGVISILCSKCGEVIKTKPEFNNIEKYALAGVSTLTAMYCDKHKYMNMSGIERDREKLRKGIKEKIRESIMKTNVLNFPITKANQVLYIMRGVPGSGKSTKTKTLVGGGVIHSTDTLIEEITGDYDGYFAKMIESNDWSEHSKMHQRNFLFARTSMIEGISPIIIDNTNLRLREVENYIIEALKLGFDETNIKIVDVGLGGQTAKVLAERNSHNVPLKTIQKMIRTYNSVGEITVARIVENYLNKKEKKVLYSAVVLNESDRGELLSKIGSIIPDSWRVIAHHMTIVFGKGIDDKSELGKKVELTATHLGKSDMAIAVKVDGYESSNNIPHITLAINEKEGGKPVMSNKITNWKKLPNPISIKGVVTDIKV